MIKYCGHYITFQEVPNEVALTLSITNCTHACEGCHSPWLRADIGDELTPFELTRLIDQYRDGITCVCFMGEGTDPRALANLILVAKVEGKKVCLYSGESIVNAISALSILPETEWPEYLKIGPYEKSLGGLAEETTNQRMLERLPMSQYGPIYEDITSWFWNRKKEKMNE